MLLLSAHCCFRIHGREVRGERERMRGGTQRVRARRLLRHVRQLRVRLPARVHRGAVPRPGKERVGCDALGRTNGGLDR